MKKAFGQTVRDLKREVNKKVLKVPGIEQKVLDATSNEPWGPHGSHLADIAQASRNHHEYQLIMSVIWKRINDTGRNWRHVYKGLTVLEYLVAHGTDRVIDEIKEHAHQISTLSDFQYIDSSGRDQGSNVRKKSQMLVALVNNRERIEEIRQKASSNQDKYRNGPYLSSAGGHGDRYDDDRYGSRYGSRDDGKYGRGGGPNGRDSEGYYGRDDNNRGTRGNDDYRVHSRARSVDGGGDRSFDGENNDHYMSRNPDERLSEQNIGAPPSYEEVMRDAQSNNADEREDKAITMPELKAQSPSESKSSSPSGSTNQCQSPTAVGSLMSPGNEEILSFEEFDPRGSIIPAAPLAGNSTEVDFLGSLLCEDSSNSSGLVPESSNTTSGSDIPENPSFEDNFMALPLTSSISHQTNQDPFGDSPFKAIPQEGFLAHSTSNINPFGPVDGSEPPSTVTSFLEDVSGFDFGDPLHASNVPSCQPVSAKPEVLPTDLSAAQPNVDVLAEILPQTGALATIPLQTMPDVPPARSQTAPADLFSQLAFPELTLQTAGPNPFAQSGSLQLQTFPAALPNPFGQPELLSQTAASGHFSQSNVQVHGLPPNNVSPIGPPSRGTPPSLPGQSGLSPPVQTAPLSISVQSTKLSQSNEKFEPKSAVWADTLSRGLINLDISGVKTNPLAEIGIDFDSINRMEKRKEQEKSSATPMSTITMGKAMGSGSGIGRAGANGIASLNLMMGANMGMGMGMGGYAGGMNQPMGMGMGMHMGMGMDMAMGQGTTMRPGFGMPPGPGVPGSGYNPMMGMGGYGSQQPYGGGYR